MLSRGWQQGVARSPYRLGPAHDGNVFSAAYLFLFAGLRFSMNAAMPSERSSSAKVE